MPKFEVKWTQENRIEVEAENAAEAEEKAWENHSQRIFGDDWITSVTEIEEKGFRVVGTETWVYATKAATEAEALRMIESDPWKYRLEQIDVRFEETVAIEEVADESIDRN